MLPNRFEPLLVEFDRPDSTAALREAVYRMLMTLSVASDPLFPAFSAKHSLSYPDRNRCYSQTVIRWDTHIFLLLMHGAAIT